MFKIATLENNLSSLGVDASGYIGYNPNDPNYGKFTPVNPFLPQQVKILSGKTIPDVVKSFEILLGDFKKEFGFMDDILAVSLRACLQVPDVESRNKILNASKNYVRIFTNIYRSGNGSQQDTAKAKFEAVKAYGMELEETLGNEILYSKNVALSGFFKDVWNKVLKPAVCVAGTIAAGVLTAGSSTIIQGLVGAGVGVATSFIKNPNQNIGQALNSALPGALSTVTQGTLDSYAKNFNPFKYGTSINGMKRAQEEFKSGADSLIASFNSSPIAQAVVGTVGAIASNPDVKSIGTAVTDFAKNTLKNANVSASISGEGYALDYNKQPGQDAMWSASAGNTATVGLLGINPIWLIAGGLGLFLILKK